MGKDRLTVPEILERAGHPVGALHGSRWRTTCPVCQNTNAQAFSYTDEVWHCFRCGEGGNALTLQRVLGTAPLPERLSLGGVTAYVALGGSGRETGAYSESVTARLSRLAREVREEHLELHRAAHREASDLLADADALFRYTGEAGLELAVELAIDADRLFLMADRVLGCPCSRVASGL